MGELTPIQILVENFIEKNRIHLSSYALINKKVFRNQQHMEDEIRNAKNNITHSVGKFLLQKGKIKKYVKESDDKELGTTKLSFDVFVFSEDELRKFVKTIAPAESIFKRRILN